MEMFNFWLITDLTSLYLELRFIEELYGPLYTMFSPFLNFGISLGSPEEQNQ